MDARGQAFLCQRCGAKLPLPLPSLLQVFIAVGKGFEREHAACAEPAQ